MWSRRMHVLDQDILYCSAVAALFNYQISNSTAPGETQVVTGANNCSITSLVGCHARDMTSA